MTFRHIRVILFFMALGAASGSWAVPADTDEPETTPAPAMPAAGEGAASNPQKTPSDDAKTSPVAVVKQLNASLQNVLEEAEQLGYAGRVDRLSPVLDAAFDFEYMAGKTVGRHWSKLSPDEQKRWVETFADLTDATYAGRFDKFSGQTFEFVDEQPGTNGSVVVRSKVVSPGEDDVNLSYRLGETPAGWKVIDVYYKGTVSELALRRADYASVLKNDGFDALIARVNEKISQLSAGETP